MPEQSTAENINTHVYADLLKRSMHVYKDKDCLHIKRNGVYQSWTYGQVHRDLNRCVSALHKLEFKKGDNAVVIGENTPEWVLAYHGALLSGGCTVPVDPNLPLEEIWSIVRFTEARVIFCSPSFIPLMREMREKLEFIAEIVVLDPAFSGPEKTFERFLLGGDESIDAFQQQFEPDDPMVIIFTSGTTGTPKGVQLVQKNYTTVGLHAIPRMHLNHQTTALAILPLHHVFGFAACIAAELIGGMDIVFVPQIKGPLILEALNDKKISMLPAVPKMLAVLYDNIERKVKAKGPAVSLMFRNLKSLSRTLGPFLGKNFRRNLFKTAHEGFGGNLQLIVSGGASLPHKYYEGFRLMGFDIVEGYGLTETFGPITLCPADKPKFASVGPILNDNEIHIDYQNEQGIGEVLLRGMTLFAGYYKNEEATRAVMDEDGWFHTGDLGRLDDDGYLYIVGRSKDLIVLESGKNVYPDELEDFYAGSEIIEEIGIFGAKRKNRDIVAALIVPHEDIRKSTPQDKAREIIHNELIRMGRDRPSYKRITDFEVVYEPLPRTTTRKLKKHELRAAYEELKTKPKAAKKAAPALSATEEALLEIPEFKMVIACAQTFVKNPKKKAFTPKTNLEFDLEMDSLRQLDFFCCLEEKFSVQLPEDALLQMVTLGDVYGKVMEAKETRAYDGGVSPHTIRERIATADLPAHLQDSNNIIYNKGPALVSGVSKLLWRVDFEGLQNIPQNKPTIFAANHQSVMDIVWILGALPWQVRRKTFSIGKKELLHNPATAPIFKSSNLIPVEREGDIIEALKTSIGVLKQGKNLVIFPEGTRSRDGSIQSFKAGVGLLILETNPTIVPIRIRNGDSVWPAGKAPRLFVGKKNRPTVTFGKPLTLQTMIEEGKASPYSSGNDIATALRDIVSEI
ncbi:MAG: AMP-binding protein [Chitinivibrionales bacterium]